MITIYHNPRCRKSREGLAIVTASNAPYEVVEYLKNELSASQISGLLSKLDMSAIDLVRKGETIWKEQYKGRQLSEQQIIEAMATHPKLIERPIVVKGDKAVVGRPPENIAVLLD
ncbi:MAG: arsenate reductase (glutaredoxin) [Dokdonia sp.]|jgi:arsenate reductase|nr:arsenate reductase (glutaredoxin) [Cytophagaceae bacterium]